MTLLLELQREDETSKGAWEALESFYITPRELDLIADAIDAVNPDDPSDGFVAEALAPRIRRMSEAAHSLTR